jgi:hypothetical protein
LAGDLMAVERPTITWQRHIDMAGAAAEHAIVGPYTLIACEFAATARSRRQCGWEIILSNKRQLAHGDSATLEDAKREAEAALQRVRQ